MITELFMNFNNENNTHLKVIKVMTKKKETKTKKEKTINRKSGKEYRKNLFNGTNSHQSRPDPQKMAS